MQKLELKHLAPYLPYGLNFYVEHLNGRRMDNWVMGIETNLSQVIDFQNKPILRPLSDLTKEIKVDGGEFIPIVRLYNKSNKDTIKKEIDFEFVKNQGGNLILRHKTSKFRYTDFIYGEFCFYKTETHTEIKRHYLADISNQYFLHELLFEWHFDVFGLIEKGLAIDINTLDL